MNRPIILTLALTMGIGIGSAAILTPDEALQRAQAGSSAMLRGIRADAPRLIYTYTDSVDSPAVYVFSTSHAGGFCVLSASDVADPVLGYADYGSFDPADLPPAFVDYLSGISLQIAAAEATGGRVVTAPANPELESVTPILTTRWNQDAPYNNLCPVENGHRSYTGCLATAFAQVLNTYRHPLQGQGSHSYSWRGTELTFDYGATTFDWDNMADSYDASSTQAQRDAVATLMYAVGVGSDMDYSSAGSGAVTLTAMRALINNFGYDKSMHYCLREYYGLDEWSAMLQAEMAMGYPLYYEGYGTGGHAFVLDGYDAASGFFHVNWGWGGSSDGYFQITTLEPGSQGIGGSSAGYANNQRTILGLRPDKGSGSDYIPTLCLSSDLCTPRATFSRDEYVETLGGENSSTVFSFSVVKLDIDFGLKLTAADGSVTYVWTAYGTLGIDPYSGYSKMLYWGGSFPSSGIYDVTMVARYNGNIYPIPSPIDFVNHLTLTCTSSELTFEPVVNTSDLKVSDLKLITPAYAGKSLVASATITNEGAEYFGEVKLGFVKYRSSDPSDLAILLENTAIIDIIAGESVDVEFCGSLAEASSGLYRMGVYDRNLNLISSQKIVSIKEMPAEDAAVEKTGIRFVKTYGGVGTRENPFKVLANPLTFDVTLSCTSGYFDNDVWAWFYKPGVDNPLMGFHGSYLPFDAGNKADVHFTGDASQLDTETLYVILIYDNSRGGWIDASGTFVEIIEPIVGIDRIDAPSDMLAITPNPADIEVSVMCGQVMERLTIFSATGIPVIDVYPAAEETAVDTSSLPAGHYIVKVMTASGATLTTRLIRR